MAHVNTMAATHKIPGVKLGRSWRFPEAALMQFFDEQAKSNLTWPAPVPSFTPITKPRRGKPRPDLLQVMAEAGMSSEEQISLIFEAGRKSKPQQ
ncbi:helix-turn-helix domain-containing protein [Ralstonia insidiosa]|nr:helix-turn-helix domain-containing protein [Ralstonia insidiosa]